MASHFSSGDKTPKSVPTIQRAATGSSPYSRDNAAAYATARRGGRPGSPRRGRVVAIVVCAVVALLLVMGGTVGFMLYRSAMTVKASAATIMDQVDPLKESLKSGDEAALSNAVSTIVSETDTIQREVSAPLWTVASFIPVIGEDVRSVQTLGTVASDLVNEALVPITDDLAGVQLSSLFQDGVVNVGLIQEVSGSLGDALPVIQSSVDAISARPEAHIPQLREVLDRVQGPVSEAGGVIEQVKPMIDLLPQMLGADGQTRTYLIVAQNNAELRSTGGLPGSWGTITVTDGAISMGGDFHTVLHKDGLRASATDEEISYVCATIHTDPAQMNFTPDFTRVGTLAREYWEQVGNGSVDGVIAIDPVFLQRLLALTGGFTAADGTVVDGSNAASILLNGAYKAIGDDGDAQDAFFASVAAQAFDHVMNNLGGVDMTALLDVIQASGEDGRLLVWMANEDEEALMDQLGLSGALEDDPATPELGVYLNDSTVSKISWYASTSTVVGEGVTNADGTTTYDVTTTLSNTITPEEAQSVPRYISGYNPQKRDVTDMLVYLYVYAPAGGSISNYAVSEGGMVDGMSPIDCTVYGRQVINSFVHARAGETVTITYQVTVPAGATEPLSVRTTPLGQESLMSVQEPGAQQ